jgi:signal transduction histidine kinase
MPRQQLEQAYTTILDLSSLVNDLALLTQAEQAGIATSGELIDDPVEFLQQIVHEFSKKAAAKSLALHVMAPEVLPGLVTKKFYLGKILESFISNAIKYTPEGSVIVSATQAQDTGIIFSVKDTGMGIEQADKDKIFKKFYRSEDYRIRQTSGTGLGLYIASKLAINIHGKIWLESKLGEGATFYLHAPSIDLPEKSKPRNEGKPASKEHNIPVNAKVVDA